jgi:uncharacterized protein involved in outer membrane biogenesis
MKKLFKWAFRLFMLLVVLAVAGWLLLDTVARKILEDQLSQHTGLQVKIGRVRVGVFSPRATIENLVIYNSADFGGSPLLDLPELHVEYDRDALFSRKLHFRLVRVNLAQLNVIEDKNGRVNLERLDKTLKQTGGPATPAGKSSPAFKFVRIDTLNLTLGKASFMSIRDPAMSDELKADMRGQLVSNVKSWDDLNGVLFVISAKNGLPLFGRDSGDPNDPKHYWSEKIKRIYKK